MSKKTLVTRRLVNPGIAEKHLYPTDVFELKTLYFRFGVDNNKFFRQRNYGRWLGRGKAVVTFSDEIMKYNPEPKLVRITVRRPGASLNWFYLGDVLDSEEREEYNASNSASNACRDLLEKHFQGIKSRWVDGTRMENYELPYKGNRRAFKKAFSLKVKAFKKARPEYQIRFWVSRLQRKTTR